MKKRLVIAITAVVWMSTPITAQVPTDPQSLRQEERDAYNAARHDNTVDAWEIFMNNYPDSYYREQARKNRDAAIVTHYCNARTTLDQLVAYIDDVSAQEPRIRLFYANLVNNPTHSYRYEHMDLGFNGCTGTVKEHIEWADGKTRPRDNRFVFNAQGLLTQSAIMGSNGKLVVRDYTYGYDNLHGYSIRTMMRGKETVQYAPFYDESDKLQSLKGTDNSAYAYTYGDYGVLSKLVVADGKTSRTLLYHDGYIIREETGGKALRYLYDFDTATGKKYLIAIREMADGQTVHERTFDYKVDTRGRLTRVVVSQDGKPQMTITRSYQ
ncbi:MAG: hypothetical protein IKH19_02450 [Muribaculaceae bacterium]|nr:hypothetical protein [Muribaculaceae bacterium]